LPKRMRRAAWPKPGWPTANANSSTPAANSKSCSVGIVRPLEVSVAPPTVGPGQRMVAAEIDGLGRHLTEVLDDDTSALSVRARIHADAHLHRQLRVGPAAAAPDIFDMFDHCPPRKPFVVNASASTSPLAVTERYPTPRRRHRRCSGRRSPESQAAPRRRKR
jgi:hypothetical protein